MSNNNMRLELDVSDLYTLFRAENACADPVFLTINDAIKLVSTVYGK